MSQNQINAEFQPILQEFRKQVPRYMYPEDAFKVKFLNVNEGILGKFQNTLLALFGAVTLLLFIACGNVANLLTGPCGYPRRRDSGSRLDRRDPGSLSTPAPDREHSACVSRRFAWHRARLRRHTRDRCAHAGILHPPRGRHCFELASLMVRAWRLRTYRDYLRARARRADLR